MRFRSQYFIARIIFTGSSLTIKLQIIKIEKVTFSVFSIYKRNFILTSEIQLKFRPHMTDKHIKINMNNLLYLFNWQTLYLFLLLYKKNSVSLSRIRHGSPKMFIRLVWNLARWSNASVYRFVEIFWVMGSGWKREPNGFAPPIDSHY